MTTEAISKLNHHRAKEIELLRSALREAKPDQITLRKRGLMSMTDLCRYCERFAGFYTHKLTH